MRTPFVRCPPKKRGFGVLSGFEGWTVRPGIRVSGLENVRGMGDIPTMTVTADAKKRVVLAEARPGDRFDKQVSADGTRIVMVLLEPVQPKPANVRLEKKRGFTVAVSDQPINEKALAEALAEFP
jgi:hypothetical protein